MIQTGFELSAMAALGIDLALRSTLLLSIAWIFVMILRRRSAAARHLVWAAASVGVLALPLIKPIAPAWQVLPVVQPIHQIHLNATSEPGSETGISNQSRPVLSQNSQAIFVAANPAVEMETAESNDSQSSGIVPAGIDPMSAGVSAASFDGTLRADGRSTRFITLIMTNRMIELVWLSGVVILLLPVVAGCISVWNLRRFSHRAPQSIAQEVESLTRELRFYRTIHVLLSDKRDIPMTWGLINPVILLPLSATNWTPARLRMILLHEMGHIRRYDYVTQLSAQLARAMYWFNPLSWLALQQIRKEQEQACDDMVLNGGVSAEDYAAELLAITTRLPGITWDGTVALAMSRTTRIERRLHAILNSTSARHPLPRRSAFAILASLTLTIACVVVVQPRAVASGINSPPVEEQATTNLPPGQLTVSIKTAASGSSSTTDRTVAFLQGDRNAKGPDEEKPSHAAESSVKAALQKISTLSPNPVDQAALYEAAIRGMLQSLDDPYSALLTPQQIREFSVYLDGSLAGIGAQLTNEKNEIVVALPLPKSPAMQGGLKARDVIVEIDGQPAKDLTETVKSIRGTVGTEVHLKVKRNNELVSLVIKRDHVRIPSVKGLSFDDQGTWQHWLNVDQKIAYVQISVFDRETGVDFKAAVTQLQSQGLRGLILDLRGNFGGMLTTSVEVAQLLLKAGTICTTRGRQPEQNMAFKVDPMVKSPFTDFPLVVLIDPTTASAAEVLAAALHDNNRAVLLGERTFGKGSVQTILPLEDGGLSLKLTTAQMISPSGRAFDRKANPKMWGIDPDDGYYIPQTTEQRLARQTTAVQQEQGPSKLPSSATPEDVAKLRSDLQLAAALKALSAKLKTGEFEKSGRPLADQEVQINQREELRKQRDELRRKVELLDRELGADR